MVAPRYETTNTLYPYVRAADQDGPPRTWPVIVVGGGPVGLALALDLGQRGTPVVVLDDHEGAGLGSKAICFAKRSLEIAHRLGVAEPMIEKGIVWNQGRVFCDEGELFNFNLLPEEGHRHPAFINLQQPYFEEFLVQGIRRAQANGAPIDIRGCNRVTAIAPHDDHTRVEIETPDGPYTMNAEWLVACDGARSSLRDMMGMGFEGRVFEDNFLIADVRMTADFPTERWFWFRPPFKDAGQSALLHKQPDDVWRIDFQLGWDIDRELELQPDRIRARVDAMLSSQTGHVPQYELVWTSIYTFQCRRMEDFRKGRVLFAGDAAPQVSPFGARGANSGVQDAENLAWKLHLVCNGIAPERLIDTYCEERELAANENILYSTRATDFMTPKSKISALFRDAVLTLAADHAFARPLVNSGRLSMPSIYDGCASTGKDTLNGPSVSRPGAPCPDGPLDEGYLLDKLDGGFTLLTLGDTEAPLPMVCHGIVPQHVHIGTPTAVLRERYLGDAPGAVYLIRPDHHVVARWPHADEAEISAAMGQAIGLEV